MAAAGLKEEHVRKLEDLVEAWELLKEHNIPKKGVATLTQAKFELWKRLGEIQSK